jgi:hypothetical protein
MGQRPPMPQGMPPVRAAHGGNITQLMSNLGNHYGNGGIVAFNGEDESVVKRKPELSKEEADAILRRMEERLGLRPRQAIEVPPVDNDIPGFIAGDTYAQKMREIRGVERGRPTMDNDPRTSPAPEVTRSLAPEVTRSLAPEVTRSPAATETETPIGEPGLLSRGPERPLAGLGASLSALGSRFGQALRGKQLGSMNLDTESIPKETPAYSNEGREPASAPAAGPSPQALALLAAQKQKPPRLPAAPAAPPPVQGTPYSSMDATRRNDFPSDVSNILSERMRQNPEAKGQAEIDRMNQMIGKPDNAAILETIASLKAKREKAAAGADPLMDMLRGIAGARPGQKWWQSGVAGSEYAANKAAQREAADTAYLEQILGHQQKVADTDRAYKTQLYTASSAVADRAAKEVYDAAIASKKSHEEAAKLAQEERIRVMEMVSREKTNAATNAAHITVANTGRGPNFADTQKIDALKEYKASHPNADPLEAIAAVNAALMGTKYTGTDKSYEHEKMVQGVIKDRTSLIDMGLQKSGLKPEEEAKLIDRRKAIEMQVRKEFPAPKGEARPGAALPMPATQADLVTGKIYDTARGPARWNGSGFTSI